MCTDCITSDFIHNSVGNGDLSCDSARTGVENQSFRKRRLDGERVVVGVYRSNIDCIHVHVRSECGFGIRQGHRCRLHIGRREDEIGQRNRTLCGATYNIRRKQ